LRGHFAQLLRYAAPADARSITVRLRSAGTASLALEQNSALKMGSLRTESLLEVKGLNSKRKKVCILWRKINLKKFDGDYGGG
jgi:hypothetical protein